MTHREFVTGPRGVMLVGNTDDDAAIEGVFSELRKNIDKIKRDLSTLPDRLPGLLTEALRPLADYLSARQKEQGTHVRNRFQPPKADDRLPKAAGTEKFKLPKAH